MSKRKRSSSIEKKLKEGLGQGTGIDLKICELMYLK